MARPELTVSGTDATCFTFGTQLPQRIESAGSSRFSVIFTPGSIRNKNAAISFTTNDTENPGFTFYVSGTGIDHVATPEVVGGNNQSFPDGFGSVLLTCATPESKIYYTIDGSDPAVSKPGSTTSLYDGQSITLNINDKGTGTIKVMASADALIDSPTVTAMFTKKAIETPVITAVVPFESYYYPDNLPRL